jgi:hypothetical protein
MLRHSVLLVVLMMGGSQSQSYAQEQAEKRDCSEQEDREEAQFMIANVAQMVYNFGQLVADPHNTDNVKTSLMGMAGSMINIMQYGMCRSPRMAGMRKPVSMELITQMLMLMVDPLCVDKQMLQEVVCELHGMCNYDEIIV